MIWEGRWALLKEHVKREKQYRNRHRDRDLRRQCKRNKNKAFSKCGKTPSHCPAKSAECNNCAKRGHYVCRSNSTVDEVAGDLGGLFLGELDTREEMWRADINMRGTKVTLKQDSGTDLPAIPEQMFERTRHRGEELKKAQKPLYGPGGVENLVWGQLQRLYHMERGAPQRKSMLWEIYVRRYWADQLLWDQLLWDSCL